MNRNTDYNTEQEIQDSVGENVQSIAGIKCPLWLVIIFFLFIALLFR